MRVKRGTIRARKRARLLKRAKGFRWGRKNIPRLAKVAVLKAGVHAYRDRRRKKREFRKLWNIQINAGARTNGSTYAKLMSQLKGSKIELNRKMLAELAEHEPKVFAAVVTQSQK